METYYLILVIVLFGLAISDLIVGVSNDAVNFLNSAIGSKVASRTVIMTIASLGILIGATFSSGLMEIARKGIFHPDQFLFSEIMIIFVAVMITDIILLDLFNTFGLPTSTTVSIVFELLGAAVAVAIINLSNINGETILDIGKYINSDKAFEIITGIFISILIAFSIGAIVMFLTRIVFSFQYHNRLKFFGAIWGSIAITAITYFMFIKGLKGASFVSENTLEWVMSNTLIIITISFIGWMILLQFLKSVFRLNIPRLIVLIGTFGLAMAFAGNDLVNFIGVPLAGLSSYQVYLKEGTDSFLMAALNKPVQTQTFLLLLAGVVMTLTLWFSKKARSVTETEVNLGRQDEGTERFGSTAFSRMIVSLSIDINNLFLAITPKPLLTQINKQFTPMEVQYKNKLDIPAFDLIRASTNLTLASIIISFATSMKLPLSTTYVTFMVAMGTSLADRAWGRESAVYRITGVLTVIGGWFLTAVIAFVVAATFAVFIYYLEYVAVFILIAIAIFFVIRTHIMFKKSEKTKEMAFKLEQSEATLNKEDIISISKENINQFLDEVILVLKKTMKGIERESIKDLKSAKIQVKELDIRSKNLKNKLNITIKSLNNEDLEAGIFYIRSIDFIREIFYCLEFIVTPSHKHFINKHKPLTKHQNQELSEINQQIANLITRIKNALSGDLEDISQDIEISKKEILKTINKFSDNQIHRIKNKEIIGSKSSVLFFNILEEAKNMTFFVTNLFAYQKDFLKNQKLLDNYN